MTLNTGGNLSVAGDVRVCRTRGKLQTLHPDYIRDLVDPARADTEEAADWRSRNRGRVLDQAARLYVAEENRLPCLYGELYLTKITRAGEIIDLGLSSLRVVTDTGVGYIVDAFQNLTELENMRYHGIGTGTNAEAAGNTALQTELTTQLNPDNTRATGTITESAANIYQTVATNTVDATVALTEHGIFSQAATGGGVLLDRSVYAAVNLVSGDSLQTDYRLTLVSGS